MAKPRTPIRPLLLLVAVLLLVVPACKVDNDTVDEIGVTRIFFVDPTLLPQVVVDTDPPIVPPEERIQTVEWNILRADMTIGEDVLDLTAGRPCQMLDVRDLVDDAPGPDLLLIPVTAGDCGTGLVARAISEAEPAFLELAFTMTLTREKPWDADDLDLDGVDVTGDPFDMPCDEDMMPMGCDDNCPFVDNPGQEDADGDGFGDACESGGLLDSDGDDAPDGLDNCVAVANGSQDGGLIGDACEEQVAEAQFAGSMTLEPGRFGPFDFTQPLELGSFVVVDVSSADIIDTCDWDAGTCDVLPAMIRVCTALDTATALAGC